MGVDIGFVKETVWMPRVADLLPWLIQGENYSLEEIEQDVEQAILDNEYRDPDAVSRLTWFLEEARKFWKDMKLYPTDYATVVVSY